MTADHEHTPTTEVVKDAACFPRNELGTPRGIDREAFDRWLATIVAAAEQRGAVKALRDVAEEVLEYDPRVSLRGIYAALRSRADLLEGDDEKH